MALHRSDVTRIGLGVVVAAAAVLMIQRRSSAPAMDPEAAEVHAVWQRYLASKRGRLSSMAGTPSADWIASEQKQWPIYDLAAFYLADDVTYEVLGVRSVEAAGGREYRITTRFRHRDANAAPTGSTVTIGTVYAVRDGGRWKLANALPRHTRDWKRDTVGPITYVHHPRYPYDGARARRAVAFTDSIAAAFGVPKLGPLTYYLAETIDEVFAIMGLESDVKFGATGGLAQPVNRQLFSGIPSVGEEYRHELAHLVLAPLVGSSTRYFISEGVPTWLGGTRGLTYADARAELAAFLETRPAVSLDSMLAGDYSNAVRYPAAAVLVSMMFDAGGTGAVKDLFGAGPTDAELKAVVQRRLAQPWPAVADAWRTRVMGVAR